MAENNFELAKNFCILRLGANKSVCKEHTKVVCHHFNILSEELELLHIRGEGTLNIMRTKLEGEARKGLRNLQSSFFFVCANTKRGHERFHYY